MIKFRLKEIMKSKGLKISDLNEATGISRNSLSLLINGKSQGIQFENLEKIASELSVEIGDLFERVFNNLEIELDEKEEIYVKKQNVSSKYINSPKRFFALKCNLIEDDLKRTGYIPYEYSVTFKPEISISFGIDLKYSELQKFLKELFEDYPYLQYIFILYFAQKVLEIETKELQKLYSNFDITKNEILFVLSGGNSTYPILPVNHDNFEISSNDLIGSYLDTLNESNIYDFDFKNNIHVSLKNT
ncbi:helix-turn-helix transcriptional regulator [Mammaliicoccus sp. H-M33]|uniref:helix-turn-helix domain-containing protein n=1 Tax=Mammaliicoccus sp. H-M33 TaxID=2898692 RepID=UPI001EFA6197|nr:helix-turn-helix transcriptional regulator [Mammaliicoccus sp. H-M33]